MIGAEETEVVVLDDVESALAVSTPLIGGLVVFNASQLIRGGGAAIVAGAALRQGLPASAALFLNKPRARTGGRL